MLTPLTNFQINGHDAGDEVTLDDLSTKMIGLSKVSVANQN